jgi:hypothetical protein
MVRCELEGKVRNGEMLLTGESEKC